MPPTMLLVAAESCVRGQEHARKESMAVMISRSYETVLGNDFALLEPVAFNAPGKYEAEQLSTGKPCTIVATPNDGSATSRLLMREPRILVRLPTDHVPQVLKLGQEHNGLSWYAVEQLDGY